MHTLQASRRDLLVGLALALTSLPRSARAEASGVAPEIVGRWLAGLATPVEATPEWSAYAANEEGRAPGDTARLRTLTSWSAQALAPLLSADCTLVYPFSGPDLFHALALFPNAPRVFLLGLEPVVSLPSPPAPQGFFARLDAARTEFHRRTFFRTRDMQTDLRPDGVLPILVATIARTGGRLSAIATREAPPRARIDWTTAAGASRQLDYAQVDLSNSGLKRQATLIAELRSLAPHVTFLKAASYLLADDAFSYVRALLLEGSNGIIQDDSGIPFRDFDSRWQTRLFGAYEAPATPFEDQLQPELRAAFAGATPRPLPFAIGYHRDPRASNLVVAVKVR